MCDICEGTGSASCFCATCRGSGRVKGLRCTSCWGRGIILYECDCQNDCGSAPEDYRGIDQ